MLLGYKLWLLLHGVWRQWVISMLPRFCSPERPVYVNHLMDEGRFQEKKWHKNMFYRSTYAGRVGLNKQAQPIPQCLHPQNPVGNLAGPGTNSFWVIPTRWHHHGLSWPISLTLQQICHWQWIEIVLFHVTVVRDLQSWLWMHPRQRLRDECVYPAWSWAGTHHLGRIHAAFLEQLQLRYCCAVPGVFWSLEKI